MTDFLRRGALVDGGGGTGWRGGGNGGGTGGGTGGRDGGGWGGGDGEGCLGMGFGGGRNW